MNARVQSQQSGPDFRQRCWTAFSPLAATGREENAPSAHPRSSHRSTVPLPFGLTGSLTAWGVCDALTSILSSSKGRDNEPDGSIPQARFLLSYRNNKESHMENLEIIQNLITWFKKNESSFIKFHIWHRSLIIRSHHSVLVFHLEKPVIEEDNIQFWIPFLREACSRSSVLHSTKGTLASQ